MKHSIFMFLFMYSGLLSAQPNFWENPEIVDEGKEPPRADFIPYASIYQLTEDYKFASPYVEPLNGIWKFNFVDKVADRPVDFYSEILDDNSWEDIEVPGSWETQGFGIPVYTNIKYIFPVNPPYVDNNDLPIGTYRTWFEIPPLFKEKEIILYFGSIAGAATIYVNGQRVGYSKASKTPAEFNITRHLKKGRNLLAIQIFKWSDASYLEDQDFWRLSGIERDVMLIARPKVSIENFFIIGDLDKQYKNGIFSADITIRNFTDTKIKNKMYEVEISLLDKEENTLYKSILPIKSIPEKGKQTISFHSRIKTPKLWTAESPNLYTVCIKLNQIDTIIKSETRRSEILKTIEIAGSKIGFKKVEIRDNQLIINGKPVLIRGVNLHEHHEKYGHYVDELTMLEDIRLLKLHNFNAIRTSHYPQSPEVYKLCDQYGLYVVDEANIEAHGLDGFDRKRHPSFLESWKGQHMDRTIRMFERDKNFTSIIGWSLGNESDFGPNYEATYQWLKQNDKAKRPVQCNRAYENPYTDIVCPMYDLIDNMEKYGQRKDITRPYIQCEYAHAMGNSTGNFQEFWDVVMESSSLQGGFIWDWVDQGLETFDEQSRKYWAYGGDLGGHRWTHDENFCANGLVNADRTVHPGIHEVKKVYQPIWMKAIDIEKGKILFTNHHSFTDLEAYIYQWELLENGKPVQENLITVSGKPLTNTEVTISLPELDFTKGNEYFLRIKALTRETNGLVPEGHIVAEEEFPFPRNNFFVKSSPGGDLKVERNEKEIRFESGNVKGVISLINGQLSQYSYQGKPLINTAPTPNFWRAPTDNDFGYNQQRTGNIWRTAGDDYSVEKVDIKDSEEGIEVMIVKNLKFINVPYTTIYVLRKDGSVIISGKVDFTGKEHPEPSRFGMKMQLPATFRNVEYYGRGPWENYNDRNRSSFIGLYKCQVEDLKFDYIRPQENGYRTDIRKVSFTDDNGFGIQFEGYQGPVCFNARYNADEDLDPGLTKKQQHPVDIDPRNSLYVNIDLKQLGLGGDNSWGARPLKQYRMLDDSYSYAYVIRPVR